MSQTPNDDEKRLLQQVSNDVEGESSKRSREWSLNGAEVVYNGTSFCVEINH